VITMKKLITINLEVELAKKLRKLGISGQSANDIVKELVDAEIKKRRLKWK